MKKLFLKIKQREGFVILFTILISAIILMIGAGIFAIATRETVLSSTAREAQAAFYAADAGVECALYAETLGMYITANNGTQFSCGTGSGVTVSGDGSTTTPHFFKIIITNPINHTTTCAQVSVLDLTNTSQRRVISQGYNVCTPTGTPDASNPILVERDLDTTYAVGTVAPAPTGGTPGGNGGTVPVNSNTNHLPSNIGVTPAGIPTNVTPPPFSGQISPSPVFSGQGAPSSVGAPAPSGGN